MTAPADETEQGAQVWLSFTPRDTVFVRDGRSFDAAADNAGRAVLPWPSTIAGACRAALGRDEDLRWVRGPILARRGRDRWTPYFPVPADLVREPGRDAPVHRLTCGGHRIDTDLGDQVEAWLEPPPGVHKIKPLTGWLDASTMTRYLAGDLPGQDGLSTGDLDVADPVASEPRIGLARQDRKARTGYFYQAAHLRLADRWGFVACCGLPDGWTVGDPDPVPLGGRSRLADVAEADGLAWPDAPERFPGGRVLVYVATPALWPDGWRIPLPDGAELVAAAVGDAMPVATTSPRRSWKEHRRLRWAVPAGSVYLLRFTGSDEAAREEAAGRWAVGAHGRALGPAMEDILRTAGFGVVLTGVWT
ncbi:type III-B CRISPR module-associated Cmr3 family protein [Thermomonospora cellulosilytica]|uniref:CRISPR-associated protein Cmr3 n=1 Tax=Thermomonospora cellulosilytica TaxID=1411118 RepID=A0A7W3N4G0_9ACTN|nr:type III-B CRISPR module-associated Cmr3 family protein [Thermomonospora cellulosilytica]MBA9007293.1 CRISPR-associated protein Cmr3 [Thermomonospora cellulosilytica]